MHITTVLVDTVQTGSTVTELAGAGSVAMGNRGGIDGDGDGGHHIHECNADRVDGGNRGGIDGDGDGGHCACKCNADRVDGGNGGGIGWFGLQGVVGDRAEAMHLIYLCCPVEPHRFVWPRVGSYAGCRRCGGVLYLALSLLYPLLLSCFCLSSLYLLFTHFPCFFPPFSSSFDISALSTSSSISVLPCCLTAVYVAPMSEGPKSVEVLSCGKLVSTGMIVLFRKESFPVCSGWGEVMC